MMNFEGLLSEITILKILIPEIPLPAPQRLGFYSHADYLLPI